jgi:hypothetical protein
MGKSSLDELKLFLRKIELARHSSSDGQLPIPFLFENELGLAVLSYKSEISKERKGKKEHFFSLELEMSGLGNIETRVKASGKNLMVLFKLEKKGSLKVIKENIMEMKEGLERIGFRVSGIDAVLQRKSILQSSSGKEKQLKAEIDLRV